MKEKFNLCLRMLCLLLMIFIVQDIMAQGKTVSGIVTDGNEPLIGVTVQVKGNSKLGTVTDLNGHYTLNVTSAGTILVYSYVGFETTERMVGNDSKIDIQLKANSKNLDEVVVVGYGTMKKSDLTGSVSQLKSEDFKSGNDLSA